ncbi:VWA domain-containing protein [bacterium]|nr:VWA domain-containing protein [bacterium]
MKTPGPDNLPPVDPYRGFDLGTVCWGYRGIFEDAIEGLFNEGLIGGENEEVTEALFSVLKGADQNCYDHVLKEFLASLNSRTRWMLELPAVFTDVTETGRLLAEARLHFGIAYFRVLGQGGFGETPAQVRFLLTMVRRLFERDGDLALAFLRGYARLLNRLAPDEIEMYVREGLKIFGRNSQAGYAFMAGISKASETVILSLTRECRLQDVQITLAALVKALSGREVEIGDLGQLDADPLIERGSRMVCLYRWLYLPARIRFFDTLRLNRDWYLLCGLTAAVMISEKTFVVLHGHSDYRTAADLVGDEPIRLHLFTLLEYIRALRSACRQWPGARRLIRFGVESEFGQRLPENRAEEILRDALLEDSPTSHMAQIISAADRLVNVFDTARELDEPWVQALPDDLGHGFLRPCAFLPDFLYPAEVIQPPRDALLADLKSEADQRRSGTETPEKAGPIGTLAPDTPGDSPKDEGEEGAGPARYWYPEWSQTENDYLENWCGVVELETPIGQAQALPAAVLEMAAHVRRLFERLRPEEIRREKRLDAGDAINIERLIDYRVRRSIEPNPRIDFYEKPAIKRRDLAVLILLDVSGSTGETTGSGKVLDVEKHAAFVLGQGLHTLGDRFAVSGFSSNGREQCEYYPFKEFGNPWDRPAISRILGARPRNSTRIGPALRHSGYHLGQVEAKQRLIVLITDGKPMDAGYDPHTRYAQHDVRMACEENARQGIATFGISTGKNSEADMDIMFPRRRYVILPGLASLPRILPRLYVRLTV